MKKNIDAAIKPTIKAQPISTPNRSKASMPPTSTVAKSAKGGSMPKASPAAKATMGATTQRGGKSMLIPITNAKAGNTMRVLGANQNMKEAIEVKENKGKKVK